MKTVAVIGAGPAGLSAAYKLLSSSDEFEVVIFEKESAVGGLSRSLEFEGGRVDIGGHRFFSKDSEVLNLWSSLLPFDEQGMLIRDRSSHILWNKKLIRYPLQLDRGTISALGPSKAAAVTVSFLRSKLSSSRIESLEDFYIDRFGRVLYELFFEGYTYKLWGVSARELSDDWGSQRVRGISLGGLVRSLLCGGDKLEERSLTRSFWYPALGSGQLWDCLGQRVMGLGGKIFFDSQVDRLTLANNCVASLGYRKDGEEKTIDCDYVLSSMPLRDLGKAVADMPPDVGDVCCSLRYRSMVVAAMSFSKEKLTQDFTRVEHDDWVYLQDDSVWAGRCQILNNWSPKAASSENDVLLELEYYCDEGDALWGSTDSDLLEQAVADLSQWGICKTGSTPSGVLIKRIPDAYPVYSGAYSALPRVRNWADGIENLLCIGRNGQHRYNNMDHSVMVGMNAARILLDHPHEKGWIWDPVGDETYLEESPHRMEGRLSRQR